jgi:ADP-ribosylglycohydrolase
MDPDGKTAMDGGGNMLKDQPCLRYSSGLEHEPEQARDEGKDVSAMMDRPAEILQMEEGPEKEALAAALYDEIQALPVRKGYEYDEPSSLEEIRKRRPGRILAVPGGAADPDEWYDRVYGAWLGRCAGNLLGKPVEGWHRERLEGLLRDTDNYPVRRYLSSDIDASLREKYSVHAVAPWDASIRFAWIDTVGCMPEDDDLNYTVLGMSLMEERGRAFTPDDAAERWLKSLPILHCCTAERVAYRNFVNGVYPPTSACFRNPYREWVGAAIRADIFGYAAPGNPELAAELAWRDASISHVKNGVYAEMFFAAAISAAAAGGTAEPAIEAGLGQIPANCRLAGRIRDVLAWKREGIGWRETADRVHALYDEKNPHHWCHAVPNAMIVCAALLFAEGDFESAVGIAVSFAFDTDSNGATAGSVAGMILGAKRLPAEWTAPLNDTLTTGVDGFGSVRISELAARTVKLACC